MPGRLEVLNHKPVVKRWCIRDCCSQIIQADYQLGPTLPMHKCAKILIPFFKWKVEAKLGHLCSMAVNSDI